MKDEQFNEKVPLFAGIDNLGRALGERTTFRRALVRAPDIEDHGHQTDHDRATDCRPESRDRKSADEVCGKFQQECVDHNEKEPQREDDQGKGQHKENGSDQEVQKCEHQNCGEPGRERVDFYAWHDHDRQKYRDTRDQDSNDRRANPTAKQVVVDLTCDAKRRHRSFSQVGEQVVFPTRPTSAHRDAPISLLCSHVA
jgi:hypothetical protein